VEEVYKSQAAKDKQRVGRQNLFDSTEKQILHAVTQKSTNYLLTAKCSSRTQEILKTPSKIS